MATTPIVYPAPPWANPDIVLYHGAADTLVPAIVAGPVQTSVGKPYADFGRGFYTTTILRQAHTWAAQIAASRPGTHAAVIEIVVRRDDLASLETLAFVRGDFHADDLWSLIHHCRSGATGHGRAGGFNPYYDVVYGPVAAFWNQRMVIAGADQISFHTTAAETVLNSSRRKRIM